MQHAFWPNAKYPPAAEQTHLKCNQLGAQATRAYRQMEFNCGRIYLLIDFPPCSGQQINKVF